MILSIQMSQRITKRLTTVLSCKALIIDNSHLWSRTRLWCTSLQTHQSMIAFCRPKISKKLKGRSRRVTRSFQSLLSSMSKSRSAKRSRPYSRLFRLKRLQSLTLRFISRRLSRHRTRFMTSASTSVITITSQQRLTSSWARSKTSRMSRSRYNSSLKSALRKRFLKRMKP